MAEKGAIADALRQHVWPLLESRAVAPVVHRTFPLRDAAAAHRLMESSAHIGKLVLTIAAASVRRRDVNAGFEAPVPVRDLRAGTRQTCAALSDRLRSVRA